MKKFFLIIKRSDKGRNATIMDHTEVENILTKVEKNENVIMMDKNG